MKYVLLYDKKDYQSIGNTLGLAATISKGVFETEEEAVEALKEDVTKFVVDYLELDEEEIAQYSKDGKVDIEKLLEDSEFDYDYSYKCVSLEDNQMSNNWRGFYWKVISI